jgi:hypothetical protein
MVGRIEPGVEIDVSRVTPRGEEIVHRHSMRWFPERCNGQTAL